MTTTSSSSFTGLFHGSFPQLRSCKICAAPSTNNNFVEFIHKQQLRRAHSRDCFFCVHSHGYVDALSSTTIGEHLFWKGEEDHTLLLCYFLLFFAFTIRRIRFISTHRANSFPHLYHRQFVPCPIVHIAVTAAKQSLPSIVTSLVTVHPFLPPGNI